jgi:hypothetical protein
MFALVMSLLAAALEPAPLESDTVAPVPYGPRAAGVVKVDFEKGTDFSRYKTYDWIPTQEPTANPVNHVRITRAVERELELKGLKKSMESPDLRTVVDFKKVSEGTLIVDLIDDDTRLTLWRGVVTQPAPPPDEVGPVIDAAVKKVLKDYPPPAN